MSIHKPHTNNGQAKFRLKAKTALLRDNLTVTELAQKLGFSRVAVSRAINRPELPSVKRKIAEALSL